MRAIKGMLLFCLLIFIGCQNSYNEESANFQPLDFNVMDDTMSEIAAGFNPERKYDYWACVRSTISYVNSISILYETKKGFSTVDDFKTLSEGFYNIGHHMSIAYYLITIQDDHINYITDFDQLMHFFGEIDTKEEALMIAKKNGFGVDLLNSEGSSYRKVQDGFEFLLMDGAPLPKIEFIQHWVKVDKKGNVYSKKRHSYCFSMCECYKTGCDNE